MTVTTIEVETKTPYAVHVGRGALGSVSETMGSGAAILSDRNVAPLHAEMLGPLSKAPMFAVTPGEESKSLATVEQVLNFMAEADLDRSSTLIALGGGVVGDLGGLAASLYMRGIDVVQCPTTVVSQVDASVGGKTAVNLRSGKNLAGTFHQPRAVYTDPATLATLPSEEFRAGLGEVLKTGLIGDERILDLFDDQAEGIVRRDPGLLTELVVRCVRVKAGIVARDERETGERKKLNLGHTFAHAIERAAGYGRVPHGVAVATGIGLALQASAMSGLLGDRELFERVLDILNRLKLAPSLAVLRERTGALLSTEELMAGMRHDKKGPAGEASLVLLRGVGSVVVDAPADDQLLRMILT